MHPLARRISDLIGFHVRVHSNSGKGTSTIDGICRGIEDGHIVLAPSSQGERSEVPLEQIATVTPLAGEFAGQ